MRINLLSFLGFSLFLFNCKSSKLDYNVSKIEAVVEVSNMNVVYRGVSNPLKISIPNAEIIEASGIGLRTTNNNQYYIINPPSGDKVEILVKGILKNGDTINRKKSLRIVDLSRPEGRINNIGCHKCIVELTKDELMQGELEIKFVDFLFETNNSIRSFKIKFPENPTIKIDGNLLNRKAKHLANSLTAGDLVYIFDILPKLDKHFSSYRMKKVSPIKVKIVE